jgi:hypothetical protein
VQLIVFLFDPIGRTKDCNRAGESGGLAIVPGTILTVARLLSHADRRGEIAHKMRRNRFMEELPAAQQMPKIIELIDELLCLAA